MRFQMCRSASARIVAALVALACLGVDQGRVGDHARAPQHGEDRDIFERLYAVRLDRLRTLEECRSLLVPLDHQGLLAGARGRGNRQSPEM